MKRIKIMNNIKRFRKILRILVSFTFLIINYEFSIASDVGVTGAQFLKIGTGARPMGMGGAFGAIADDGYAAYWNPAGFAQLESSYLSTTYLDYFEDVDFGYLGYAMPYRTWGVIGLGISYLTLGDIEARTGDTEQPTGTFGADDICVTFSYARKEMFSASLPGLDLGANLKLIKQKIDDETAQTAAVDLGALYRTQIEPLTIAVNIQNIGQGQKFIKERDPLPLNVKVGGAYRFLDDTLITAVEIDQYIIDQKMYAGLGCEYWLMNLVALRTGYRHGYHTDSLGSVVGLTGGLSLRAFNFQLDYAFVPFGELGDTHRFSLSAKF